MIKYLVLLILLLVIAGGVYFYSNYKQPEILSQLYQGPVPQGYDEDHFRKTGLTKPLEVKR